MSNVIAVQFPNDREEIVAVSSGLTQAVQDESVKAVVVVTIEQGPNDSGPHLRLRHGWTDKTVTAYDLLALAAGIKHAELMIHEQLER